MATLDEIKAAIDARNPTKPGQYTGQPVPLGQKEQRPPTVNANRCLLYTSDAADE